MKNILIDTNVIIDFLAHRDPFFDDAFKLLTLVAEEKIIGCIAASTVTDIYYILRKHLKDPKKTKESIEKLLTIVCVLDVTKEDIINALASSMSDFEDAFLVEVSKKYKLNCVVTRNTKDFSEETFKVLTPSDYIEHQKEF